ncbi:glycine--tRNA ligase subunit beta [Bacillota bacterium LX-D]|nr:glycine--tRNA ligase subunit beta [Bacillota bacterium LX-D]
MPALLFEIGTEEIPARFMQRSINQFQELAEKIFTEKRIAYKGLKTYGTPRRIALYIEDLAGRQEDLTKEVKGPAKKVAFDADGNPTKAILGFAKGQGVAVEDLEVKSLGSGEYMCAIVKETGKMTKDILAEVLHSLLTGLNFPKPMRWGYEEMRFARPIRWLVALYGSEVVDFQAAGVKAGRETRGHRFLSQKPVILDHPQEYLAKLETAYVIVDQNRRHKEIWAQIQAIAERVGGSVKTDEELLEEVTYLVEYPTALCGSFPEKYLKLPEEVLITPMKEHQRYFPVYSSENKLLPKFITVRNGGQDYLDNVASGNEKVLVARLADAEFFYQEDQKVSLKQKTEALQNIIFQEALGTVYEKVQRIQMLSKSIAQFLNLDEQKTALVEEAALICKADLVTNMVYEFPELQGIMGGYYARLENYPEEVARGIREHYQPRFSGDEVPKSTSGIVLSIADKIDTIVGCFGIGLIPSGSQDPYALRRQALGICHILIDHRLSLSLRELILQTRSFYGAVLGAMDEEKINLILNFFRQRIQNILEDQGIRYDIVDAVLAIDFDNCADAANRAEALQEFGEEPEFAALATAFARAANLTKGYAKIQVQADDFVDDVEQKLYNSVLAADAKIRKELDQANYAQALKIISTLRQPVDDFFSQVMVMVDDEKIKLNRLGLLQMVTDLTYRIADLSKLVIK